MGNPTFILSRIDDSTRDFLRFIARRGLRPEMLSGETPLADALPYLQHSDRIWFEGIGPLLYSLLHDACDQWLPRGVLRLHKLAEVSDLQQRGGWKLLSDVVTTQPEVARQLRQSPAARDSGVRVHLVRSSYELDLVQPQLPWEELAHLWRVLLLSRLSCDQWRSIRTVAEHCHGRVLLVDAPPELANYLCQSMRLTVVETLPRGHEPPVDTLVLWEAIPAGPAEACFRQIANSAGQPPTIIAVGETATSVGEATSSTENATSPTLARLVREGGREVHVDGVVVVGNRDRSRPTHVARIELVGESPLVSVAIPVYNGEETICRTLSSLKRQTYPNIEIVVADDGSTDATAEVVRGCQASDSRIKYCYKEHSGRPETRNLCIRTACGPYLAWIDADDEALPNRIALQAELAVRQPNADVIYGPAVFVDPQGNPEYRPYPAFSSTELPALLFNALTGVVPLSQSTAMVQKQLYAKLGAYDPEFLRAQDYEFWVRAAKANANFARADGTLTTVYRPARGKRFARFALDFYYPLALRMLELFDEATLADAKARYFREPPSLVIARVLTQLAIRNYAEQEHPIYETIGAHLERLLNSPSPRDRAAALFLRGQIHQAAGETEAALRCHEHSCKIDPTSVAAKQAYSAVRKKQLTETLHDSAAHAA